LQGRKRASYGLYRPAEISKGIFGFRRDGEKVDPGGSKGEQRAHWLITEEEAVGREKGSKREDRVLH